MCQLCARCVISVISNSSVVISCHLWSSLKSWLKFLPNPQFKLFFSFDNKWCNVLKTGQMGGISLRCFVTCDWHNFRILLTYYLLLSRENFLYVSLNHNVLVLKCSYNHRPLITCDKCLSDTQRAIFIALKNTKHTIKTVTVMQLHYL